MIEAAHVGPSHPRDPTLLSASPDPAGARFTFPDGVFGFEHCKEFTLVPTNREGLWWLQAQDGSPLAFLLLDPFQFVEDFVLDVHPKELGYLAPEDPSDLAVLAIVTLPSSREATATANLQGPVALNVRKGLGRQLVIQDSPWNIRTPVQLRPVQLAS